MKILAAGTFKEVCLKTIDDVAKTRTSVIITKRGRPHAQLPYIATTSENGLAGSISKESADPFSTGMKWDADHS